MSENTDRTERMTGTPSKDRAEAHMAEARECYETLLAGNSARLHDDERASDIFEISVFLAAAFAGTASDKNPAPIQENAGRDFGNPNSAFYLSYPCWPTISRAAAWQAGPNANPSQAHAAPRIHGASR